MIVIFKLKINIVFIEDILQYQVLTLIIYIHFILICLVYGLLRKKDIITNIIQNLIFF